MISEEERLFKQDLDDLRVELLMTEQAFLSFIEAKAALSASSSMASLRSSSGVSCRGQRPPLRRPFNSSNDQSKPNDSADPLKVGIKQDVKMNEKNLEAAINIKPNGDSKPIILEQGDVRPKRRPPPPFESLFKDFSGLKVEESSIVHQVSQNKLCFEQYYVNIKNALTIETRLEFEVTGLDRPIGVAVLKSGNVAVSVSGKGIVRIYDADGKVLGLLHPGREFQRPTDMISLNDGRLAVRDDVGIQLFDEHGKFIKTVGNGLIGKAFGLAAIENQLIIVNVGRKSCGSVTSPGQTDLLFICVDSDKVVKKVSLNEVITNPQASKCRFVGTDGKIIYVGDLGLDIIYAYNLKYGAFKSFTGCAVLPRPTEPAGMVADKDGSIIIADARNCKLQIFDSRRNFRGLVTTPKRLVRPSGMAIDHTSGALYVLNLKADSMMKLKLQKKN